LFINCLMGLMIGTRNALLFISSWCENSLTGISFFY
jgi:hypothetical protein